MSYLYYFDILIWGGLFAVLAYKFIRAIRIVPQRKEYIVERLGKYSRTLDSGFHALIPFLDQVTFIQDLREETISVPPQECFTKDNVRVEVDGVIYISVVNSERASYGITNYRFGAIQLAQTTVRSVIGLLEMDTTFEERDLVNIKILEVLEKASDGWGIRVHRYEVKNIVPPETVSRAMEQQMSAERERRAMIATAEGDRESRVNRSEGQKTELINTSEGEKQRRINEAEGRAREIESVAVATADAIEKLASAIQEPGGDEAVRLRLTEQYFTKLATIGKSDTSVLLPADLSRPEALLDGLGIGVKKK